MVVIIKWSGLKSKVDVGIQKSQRKHLAGFFCKALENGNAFELSIEVSMENKQHNWCNFADALKGAIEEHCPIDHPKRKPWMSDECLDLIEERRKVKNLGSQSPEYKKLCKEVKKARKNKKIKN